MSPAELQARLTEPDLVVVDCRFDLMQPDAGRCAYQAGHIPGARYADLNRDLSSAVLPGVTGRHPLPDPAVLTEKLRAWGVSNDSLVIAYDDATGAIAARLWWLLQWLGHERTCVLDGGLAAWKALGGRLEVSEPAPEPASFTARPNPDLIVDVASVLAAAHSGTPPLLDARAAPRFYGDEEPIDAVPGHIPGARSLPFAALLADGRFAASEQVRAAFEQALAGAPSAEAICYCGSGVTACHLLLGAVHAGLPLPRLYAGSYSEWITDPTRAVERR
jgi:thiosulfate/3-mercaptopyruvate sulfurtransferase